MREAVDLYSLAGGFDWAAMPMLVELYDIDDPETLIERFAMIRDALSIPSDKPNG